MAIIDHGQWERYVPTTVKPNLPSNIMYARSVIGNYDWYEYVAAKRFGQRSVVMTVQHTETGDLIQVATFDPTAIFPASCGVIEETEYSGSDPQAEFGLCTYNADLRKIGPKYVPPPTETEKLIASLMKRIEALEKAT